MKALLESEESHDQTRYFFELIEEFDDLAAVREGKCTLRNHKVEHKPVEPAKGAKIVALHENLQMSQMCLSRPFTPSLRPSKTGNRTVQSLTTRSPF